MDTVAEMKPWERVRDLLADNEPQKLVRYLDSIPADDVIRTVFRLSADEQATLIRSLPPRTAAELLDDFPETHAADILDDITPQEAASIVEELDSDLAADVLAELDEDDLEDILEHMDPTEADEARQLISYAGNSAGGLMMTEYLAFSGDTKIGDVVAAVGSQAADIPLHLLQQIMVISPLRRLRGAVNLGDMAFADPNTRLKHFIKPVDSVLVTTELQELEDFFEARDDLTAAPVVDERNRLLGVVRRRAVFEAISEKMDEDSMKRQGIVGGDELRSLPLRIRSGRRLSWLSVNILLNIVAASVIAMYQETLAAAIALAVFLPIVSDMSGCSGNQAVAVSMRELTLGIVRPEDAFRVWMKEIGVGLINGLALGLLIAVAAWLWKQDLRLSIVVGAALALNTVVAVSIGGTIPLLLKKMNIDPALASGPALTTVTDMCGFFLVLSFASVALSM